MAAAAGPNNSNFAQSPAFADAVQRAKQIAAKIQPSSQKRPLDDSEGESSPDAKRPPSAGLFMGGLSGPMGPGSNQTNGNGGSNGGGGGDTEELPVPDKMVGLIIGRGGEQITRLQRDSGAKIQMAQDSGGMPDRICTISGPRDAIQRAKDMIYDIVSRGEIPPPKGGRGPPGGQNSGMGPPGIDGGGGGAVEISVPGPKVGLIIGKGGETIKQLQEKSGAKMVIIQDGPQQENEKPLRITGDPQRVEVAKQLVYDLLAEKEAQAAQFGHRGGRGGRGRGGFGDRGGRGDDYGDERGGFGGGGGRGGGRGGYNDWGRGGPHGGGGGGPMGRGGYGGQQGMQGGPGGPMGRGGPMGGPGGPQGGPPGGGRGDGKMEVFYGVPANKCGLVIGKGGETIRQINQQTGAHCELDRRPQSNPAEKTFIIRGNPDQVDSAKKIIAEKAGIPYQGSEGGGGGGGGGNGGGPQNGPNNYAPQGWGNAYQQWNQGAPNDPTKQVADANAAAWAAYYSQCYGGQQPQGQNPNQPPSQGPQPSAPGQPQSGQQDYSAQWVDYYRSMGMVREADAIEQQAKSMKLGAPASVPQQQPNSGGPESSGGPPGGNQQDYSHQWISYYRAQGQHAEADKIEAQKNPAAAGGVPQGSAPVAGPGALTQGGAPASGAPGGPGGAGQDYSQQWIEYYRNQGMNAEADKIEQQLKAAKAPGPGVAPGGGQPMYSAYNQGGY